MCEICFSNSLIIHIEQTKERWFGYRILIKHKILRTFALNFSKNYEWLEKPYQKRLFHQVSKHLELRCASFFQPTSRCLDILMKHSRV